MDKSYWTKFYAKHKVGDKPSLFAQFVWDSYLRQMQVDKKSNAKVHASTQTKANAIFGTNNANNAQNIQTTTFNGEDDYFFRVVGIARNERERERE